MYEIAVLPGDGIGPEIIGAAERVLRAAADACGLSLKLTRALIGGAAIDAFGLPLPEAAVRLCKDSHAALLGAVGGPKWDALPGHLRAEKGILDIRKELGLFANLRPIKPYTALLGASPLKREVIEGMDFIIVRELTGGIYFGERGRKKIGGIDAAFDTETYTREEIERIARVALALAQGRSGRLCSVDKANVLESSRFWREVVVETAAQYPGVAIEHMYVDNAAMQLVREPRRFDVILTNNIFGDILSDEASQIAGSIGMLASASLGSAAFGLYEPIHGSAPEIAGKGVANPVAAILSAAMLLRHSLDEAEAAGLIESAVQKALDSGARTADIAVSGEAAVSTEEMCERILGFIRSS